MSALGAVAVLAGASSARAAETAFDVPVSPLPRALTTFALQARISIGLNEASQCAAPRAPLVGRFEVERGLARLLAGTGCDYRRLDTRAYQIVRGPPQPSPQAAPSSRPPASVELGAVVVVATRRPSPASRLAYPLSVVDGETLQSQGAADLAALTALTPAMTVTNLGPGRDKVLLRGLSDGPLAGHAQAMVGLYLDGVRLTYNAPDPDLRLEDVAQVEILRGPQGALYGAGSIGGIVRVATAPPDPATRSGYLRLGGSMTEGGAPSSLVAVMGNAPTAEGRGAVRAVAWAESTGGWLDAPGGARNLNSTLRLGGRLALRFDLDETWSLSGGLVGQSIVSRDAQYVASREQRVRPTPLREPHDNDFGAIHLELDGHRDDRDLKVSLAAIRHQFVSRYDASGSSLAPRGAGLATFDDDAAITTFLAEATLSGGAAPSEGWLVGAFAANSRQDTRLGLSVAGDNAPVWSERRRDGLSELAVFGEMSRPLGRTWTLTLGGRLSTSHNDADSTTASGGGMASTFAGDLSRWRFAPKVQFTWRPNGWVMAYVEAAEGYRFGGFNTSGPPGQVFSSASGAPPRRVFHDDELWSVETGVRLRLLAARLTVRAATFAARWTNIQADQLLPTGQAYTANLGDGGNWGAEVETRFQDGGWLWDGVFLANGPEFTRLAASNPGRVDLTLAGVPDFAGAVGVRRTWSMGPARIEASARLGYVGPSRLTFGPGLRPKMGGYPTSHLDLAWQDTDWRISAVIENVLGTRGDTYAFGNPFSIQSGTQATPQRPRTVSIEVTRRF